MCFVTKALHLELVCELTTDAFITALKKFISRSGLCKNINYDSATRFVGANNKLNEKAAMLRKIKITKDYICIFICLVTTAVHIELVSDLSAPMFIAAFNRFVYRRGKCTDIFSDRVTNFVGAQRYLKQIYHKMTTDQSTNDVKVQSKLRTMNVVLQKRWKLTIVKCKQCLWDSVDSI